MATFFPKGKERILYSILDNPTKNIKVRELARELRLNPAHVSRTIKKMAEQGILKGKKVDLSNPYVKALKIFLNVKKLTEKDIVKKIRRLKALGAGIYGSCANGTNNEDSDIDIWIKVNKNPGEINVASVSNEIRAAMNKNIQILVLTPERIERLKKEDPTFYYSLVFGSFTLYGETIG